LNGLLRIRLIIRHHAERFGPAPQNRSGHRDFQIQLAGRISWVMASNRARGERQRAMFKRIDWSR